MITLGFSNKPYKLRALNTGIKRVLILKSKRLSNSSWTALVCGTWAKRFSVKHPTACHVPQFSSHGSCARGYRFCAPEIAKYRTAVLARFCTATRAFVFVLFWWNCTHRNTWWPHFDPGMINKRKNLTIRTCNYLSHFLWLSVTACL